jgi:aromatic-L-amino-acid decarboxylase
MYIYIQLHFKFNQNFSKIKCFKKKSVNLCNALNDNEMNNNEFRKYAHEFADWMADYLAEVEKYPVKARVEPGDIYKRIPDEAPLKGESMNEIFKDFMDIIIPGLTHWQSPNFFAYFPANSSYPSVLAEMLTATLGVLSMKWEVSPAATELEERMMNWLRDMTGLPGHFQGVIQDTASTATLIAILTAREKITDYQSNIKGLTGFPTRGLETLRVYCSTETHSSIEKAVRIAGIGSSNLVKVGVDSEHRLDPVLLEQAIIADLEAGFRPACVVATLGTTGVTAIDPLEEIGKLCSRHGTWLHVDAAFAGSALILPEYRWMIKGVEYADSFVFNPHKWLFTNFACSAYFVRDITALLHTLQVVPEYLRTHYQGMVNDYCDWGIALGRRFRALKLWFVLRNYGIEALQEKLRYHIAMARDLSEMIRHEKGFELMAPVTMNLVCFRYKPEGMENEHDINRFNERMLRKINGTGKAHMSHTKVNGKFTIRMVIANTNVEWRHVEQAWELIKLQT